MRISLVLVPLLLLSAAPAMAQSSTNFKVTGEITAGACTVAIKDVDLGVHAATDFTGSHTTAPAEAVLSVTACHSSVTNLTLKFDGDADSADGTFFQGVPGIGVELQEGTTKINRGTSIRFAKAAVPTLNARFHQTAAAVGAGRVTRPVTVAITYD